MPRELEVILRRWIAREHPMDLGSDRGGRPSGSSTPGSARDFRRRPAGRQLGVVP